MTTPEPPYQHYLGRITQDQNKPEIYWLEFSGSDTPYNVPTSKETIASTHDFLTNWLKHRQNNDSPWTNWSWAETRTAPEEPVTITVPYWVADSIRAAMHRPVTQPEGCQCEEHRKYTITQPLQAYEIVCQAIDNRTTGNP
jgi:hypothetical protein